MFLPEITFGRRSRGDGEGAQDTDEIEVFDMLFGLQVLHHKYSGIQRGREVGVGGFIRYWRDGVSDILFAVRYNLLRWP